MITTNIWFKNQLAEIQTAQKGWKLVFFSDAVWENYACLRERQSMKLSNKYSRLIGNYSYPGNLLILTSQLHYFKTTLHFFFLLFDITTSFFLLFPNLPSAITTLVAGSALDRFFFSIQYISMHQPSAANINNFTSETSSAFFFLPTSTLTKIKTRVMRHVGFL